MKVDFFIVGEPKSGTTALASFLDSHPEVSMSDPKEPGFFATDFIKESDNYHGSKWHPFIRTIEGYQECFKDDDSVKGEASTNYLYSNDAAKNIFSYNPNSKIIVLLRNPVDFLHSLHMQYVNEVREDQLSFKDALDLQAERKKGHYLPKNAIAPSYYQYFDWANYSKQISRYIALFGSDKVLILIHEEFKESNKVVFKKLCNFIGVDDSFEPDFKVVHGSVTPRSRALNRSLNNPVFKKTLMKIVGRKNYLKIRKPIVRIVMKNKRREQIDDNLKKYLNDYFESQVNEMSDLLKRDLSKIWKLN